MRLLHITTVPQSLFFLRGQPAFMRAHGLEVHAVSSPGPELEQFGREEPVETHAIEMRRAISPVHDLRSLAQLVALLRRLRPDIVHAHTPKGGLLGMLAATLASVPVRIYHVHGLPMVTSRGARRALLRSTEQISCALASRVLCVSHSVRELAIAEGLVAAERVDVLGHGSINGIDCEGRFLPGPRSVAAGKAERLRLGIPEAVPVIGFVGRLVRDKGVTELAAAWLRLREVFPEAHLLVVGPEEPQDPLGPELVQRLRADPRVHMEGLNWNTPPLFAAMDVVALPSYREGFPVVPLESASMGLPLVCTDVPGCREGVVDAVTGTLIPARNAAALEGALTNYLRDPELRRRHGAAGRERVLRDFRPVVLWEALLKVYMDESLRLGGSQT